MSDFLTRLSERALGLAQPVQPLIPSIYAATAAASPESDSTLHEEISERESGRSPAEPVTRRPIRQSMPPRPSTIEPLVKTQTQFEPSLFEPTPLPSTPAQPEQPLLVPRPMLQLETPSQLSAPHRNNPPDTPRRLAEGVTTPRLLPPSDSDDARYEASLLPHQRPEREPIFAERPAQTAPASEHQSAITPQRPRAAQITPIVTNDNEAESLFNDASNTEPPLNIRVTITRVEIRATTPAAPAYPTLIQREAGPTLSLNDYLQRRGGGR